MTTKRTTTKASEIRAGLSHPIVDADGHFVEVAPLINAEMLTYLEEMGGPEVRDRYIEDTGLTDTSTVLAGHSGAVGAGWKAMPSWWGWATENTLDRATAHLPALLYERLDEFGIDFTILYPSMTLAYLEVADDEMIGLRCRAANRALANLFAGYRDRTTVGALIPMLNPALAIEELEYAVHELGFKTAVFAGHARRAIGGDAYRLDTFGVDSAFDYDPLWAKCVELGIAPVFHSSLQGHRVTRSATSYVYNHVGGLAASHESLCKSLFLSGVTHRFPTLRFGFLEGGVAWACSLLGDLMGHWEKRNAHAITALDPDRLDVAALLALFERYGDARVHAGIDELRAYFSRPSARPEQLDEFAAAALDSVADLCGRFVPNFYFGCEADDRLVTWAFAENVNAGGSRLRPIFGSDISHWDVPDMTEPVAEAYELVEHDLIGQAEFRELMFLNPVRLHAGMNPDFFAGTVCEAAALQARDE
ncbi:MAG TPA: amidohydrolase family protein [Acidimicrobiia bacterium]|jgi:predicted TIM-barrel fold metal-dependent hydrolase